jgi:hypothetical protein
MKEIPLTRGLIALVDDEDFAKVAPYRWTALKAPKGRWYAHSRMAGSTWIYLHRFLMNAPPDRQVDHKDGDGLNCQRFNMRLATTTQNQQNSGRRGPTGFKGVSRVAGRWYVHIKVDGKRLQNFGGYATAEEAARVYDVAATVYHGEFAQLNFPVHTGDSNDHRRSL